MGQFDDRNYGPIWRPELWNNFRVDI